ncbi:MAG: hypothetical protein ACYC6N_02905 [Pirellulaceae bacterium]
MGLVLSSFSLVSPARADRIVLRNLDVLDPKSVTGLDEDGVQLDDGSLITWDRIERGRVSEAQQTRFDQLLGELGADLYRIRQRLSVGDFRGVLPHAEALEARYVGRCSETAYMVFQALMWSRLAAGRREAALAPYLRCVACLQAASQAGKPYELPGARRLQVDLASGLTAELSPVWFDAEAARLALPDVASAISDMEPPPAVRIYYATLALAAGAPDQAEQALAGLEGFAALRAIVDAQMQLVRGAPEQAAQHLAAQLPEISRDLRPVALYWLGKAQVAQSDEATRRAGLLCLLELPAVFGQQEPELASAGLYEALQTLAALGDTKGSIALRRELLDRYAPTWHAQKLRAEDEKVK